MTDPVFVQNRPTPEGRALGEQLARLTEKAAEQFANEDPPFPEPCKSCAFRRGTIPNGCAETVMDALKCVMEGEPFLCHEIKDEKPLCAGWYLAQASLIDKPKIETPWPFSHDREAWDKWPPHGPR